MPAGSDWTRTEVEATVSDYLDMLSQELRGEPFNKAEHNRHLLKFLPGRTRGSVERKHQNISAVLIDLGFPYIDGYKPLKNVQSLLREVIEDRLGVTPQLEDLVEKVVIASAEAGPIPRDLLSSERLRRRSRNLSTLPPLQVPRPAPPLHPPWLFRENLSSKSDTVLCDSPLIRHPLVPKVSAALWERRASS